MLSIKSRVYPAVYLHAPISQEYYYIFIKYDLFNKYTSLNHNIINLIENMILDDIYKFNKNFQYNNCFTILSPNELKRIYQHKLDKLDKLNKYNNNNITFCLNVSSTYRPYFNSLPNGISLDIKKFMDYYYHKFPIDKSIKIMERTKIILDKIQEYGKLMKQIFKFKSGIFSILNDKILDKIFKYLIIDKPHLGFSYVNPFSKNILRYEIYQREYISDIFNFNDNDNINDDNRSSNSEETEETDNF